MLNRNSLAVLSVSAGMCVLRVCLRVCLRDVGVKTKRFNYVKVPMNVKFCGSKYSSTTPSVHRIMYQTINGLESDALRFHSHSARENIHFWNGLFNINNEGLVDWISYIIFIQPVA